MEKQLVFENGYCGIEIDFGDDMERRIAYHLNSGFHFVFTPLAIDRPSLTNKDTDGSNLSHFADHLSLNTSLKWSNRLVGMISSWIDLDSDDEILRKDSEITLLEEVNLASNLSLQACLLPTPKGSSCANYVRCLNRILQNQSSMQFLLRIPLEEPDNDYDVDNLNNTGESQTNSLELWRSFHRLCDHKFQNQLFVAFDFPCALPSANSLEHWSDEPLGVAIIDSKTLKKDRLGNSYRVGYHNKLMTWLFKHSVKIVLSRNVPSEVLASNANNDVGDYSPHPLWLYLEHITFVHGAVFRANSKPQFDDDGIEDDVIFGTTVFAIKYKDGVVVGADSRQVRRQDAVTFDSSVKQFSIGDSIFVTFSGLKSKGLEIIQKLREKFKLAKTTRPDDISISLVADWASEMMGKRMTRDIERDDVHLIIVGAHRGVCEIYRLLPWEKSGSIDMAIVGSTVASTIIVPKDVTMLTREQAKDIVFKGIRRAKIVSYATGGPIKLLFIETSGVFQTEVAWPECPESSLTLHEWEINGFTPDGL